MAQEIYKIGYHYTTLSNWLRIKNIGLIPQLLQKPELEKYFPGGANVIWVWTDNLNGLAHAGSIIFQCQKGDTRIVKLKVRYLQRDALKYGSMNVVVHHTGFIGECFYHDGTQKSVLITKPISPEHIELVKEYDLIKLLK
jgi:hypothetical protein